MTRRRLLLRRREVEERRLWRLCSLLPVLAMKRKRMLTLMPKTARMSSLSLLQRDRLPRDRVVALVELRSATLKQTREVMTRMST